MLSLSRTCTQVESQMDYRMAHSSIFRSVICPIAGVTDKRTKRNVVFLWSEYNLNPFQMAASQHILVKLQVRREYYFRKWHTPIGRL